MTISVVILSYRPDDLQDLLGCLRSQTRRPDEIILIDTGRQGALQELAERLLEGAGISLVSFHRPDLGTVRGRNLGIEQVQSALTVMLDDDMLIAPDYIESASAFFSKPESRNVAGITMLGPYPGKEPEPPARSWRSTLRRVMKCAFLLDSWAGGVILPTGFRSELPGGTRRVQWLQGGNSVWRSSVLKRYKLDDELERYPYALSEDVALSARVGQDYDLYVVKASGSFHKKSPGKRLNRREFGESLIRNHRHIARIRTRRGSVPMTFYWGILGLLLHGLGMLTLRPTRDSMNYVQGLLKGLAADDKPLPISCSVPEDNSCDMRRSTRGTE